MPTHASASHKLKNFVGKIVIPEQGAISYKIQTNKIFFKYFYHEFPHAREWHILKPTLARSSSNDNLPRSMTNTQIVKYRWWA